MEVFSTHLQLWEGDDHGLADNFFSGMEVIRLTTDSPRMKNFWDF